MTKSNTHWCEKVKEFIAEGISNCRGTIAYHILTKQKNKITDKNLLLDPYFSKLYNP